MKFLLICESVDDGRVVALRGSAVKRNKRTHLCRGGAIRSLAGWRWYPNHVRSAVMFGVRNERVLGLLREAGWPAELPVWRREPATVS